MTLSEVVGCNLLTEKASLALGQAWRSVEQLLLGHVTQVLQTELLLDKLPDTIELLFDLVAHLLLLHSRLLELIGQIFDLITDSFILKFVTCLYLGNEK